MLDKQIKKVLLETKEKKEKQLIEENLVRSRILMIVESEDNIKNFNNLPKEKQEKIAYSLIHEIKFLGENDLLNEQLMGVLDKLFGSSMSGIAQSIAEPLIDSLLSKIGLSGFFKDFLTSFLATDPRRLLLALKDCRELTKLVVEGLVEAVVISLQRKTGLEGRGYSFIRNALGSTIRGTQFSTNLENQLSDIVCSVFNGFNKKASRVYDTVKSGFTE
jgi:hypothetical protein